MEKFVLKKLNMAEVKRSIMLKFEMGFASSFFLISKFILQCVVIHLAKLCVRLQWLGERHSL
jgi:hypothetical protein